MTTQLKRRLNNGRTQGKDENLYKLYKSVVENLKEGIWIGKRKNKAFSTLYWSKGAEKISGVKKQNLKRSAIFKIVPGLKQISEEIINNTNGKKRRRLNIERFEYYNSKKDNRPLYLNIQSYFLAEENMIVIIFEDITEKARMEKDIIQQNRELLALNQIGRTVTQTLELDKLLNTALDKIIEVMDCEGGGIYIREPKESEDLILRLAKGVSSNFCKRHTGSR